MISEEQKKVIEKRDNKVLSATKARKGGYSFTELQTKTGLDAGALRGSLRRLREQNKIKTMGVLRQMKYTV